MNNQTTQDRSKGQNSENRQDTTMQNRQQPGGQASQQEGNRDRDRKSDNNAGGPQR